MSTNKIRLTFMEATAIGVIDYVQDLRNTACHTEGTFYVGVDLPVAKGTLMISATLGAPNSHFLSVTVDIKSGTGTVRFMSILFNCGPGVTFFPSSRPGAITFTSTDSTVAYATMAAISDIIGLGIPAEEWRGGDILVAEEDLDAWVESHRVTR